MNDLMLGRRIRALRKNKGITQDELAKALGVTPQAVSKWERGSSFPELPLLPMLADQFDSTVDALLREDAVTMAEESPIATETSPMMEDPRAMQVLYLQALCKACMQEGDAEFESGRYDGALMAYTRGLRGLESFLTPGEDGLAAYPWQEMVSIHWELYLHRAVCFQHLGRQEDCRREAELAYAVWTLTEQDSAQANAFSQTLIQLGLSIDLL